MSYNFSKYKKIVLPEGVYPFEIISSNVNAVSKAGNDCLEIKLEITNGEKQSVIKDVIPWEQLWKIKFLLKSIGKIDVYEKNEAGNSDFLGGKGSVHLIIDTYNGNESNKVKAYVEIEDKELNDDLTPF